jgi:plasmid stabilization system protein ParE
MISDAVELSAAARADLEDVIDYITERNPSAADRLRAAIRAALATLAAPEPRADGPAVTLDTGESCRTWFVHPVTLYYQRGPGSLFVLHIRHHAREPIAR